MRPRRSDAGGAGLGSGLAETGAALLVILYISDADRPFRSPGE